MSAMNVPFNHANSERDVPYNLPLANPLERWNRLGTGWFGVICELEGVIIPDLSLAHRSAWCSLAREENLQLPLEYDMRHYQRLKAEQLVSQVFNWSHNSQEINRLISRKYEILEEEIVADSGCLLPGALEFLESILSLNIPCVLLTQERRQDVETFFSETSLKSYMSVEFSSSPSFKTGRGVFSLVTSDDVRFGLPDIECILLASSLLQRPIERIIFIGSSLQALEAARELDVRCVMLSGNYKYWELCRANLVVGGLKQICFQNLKNLFHDA